MQDGTAEQFKVHDKVQLVSQEEEVLQCHHIPAGVPRRSAPALPHSSWCPRKKKCSSAAPFQLVSQVEEVLQCRHIPAGVPRRRSAPAPPHSSWCPKKKCSSAAAFQLVSQEEGVFQRRTINAVEDMIEDPLPKKGVVSGVWCDSIVS